MNDDERTAALPDMDAEAFFDAYQAKFRRGGEAEAGAFIEAALGHITASSATEDAARVGADIKLLDVLKTWLNSFRPLPPAVVSELKKLYTVRLTYNSNAIEGNTLTQHETEMVLSHGVTIGGKTLVEHLEVIGHRDAMEYMEQLAAQNARIGEWEIKNLHSLILRPVEQVTGFNEAGLYRTLDVSAAGTEHVYPPHFKVRDLMSDFVHWLGSSEANALHPVELASEAHFRLVTIHPFRDGNGRTARLLMNLLLVRDGYPITVITNARRAEYLEALVHGQAHGNDAKRLTVLVTEACRASLIDYLALLSTADDSRGRGELFYQIMLS